MLLVNWRRSVTSDYSPYNFLITEKNSPLAVFPGQVSNSHSSWWSPILCKQLHQQIQHTKTMTELSTSAVAADWCLPSQTLTSRPPQRYVRLSVTAGTSQHPLQSLDDCGRWSAVMPRPFHRRLTAEFDRNPTCYRHQYTQVGTHRAQCQSECYRDSQCWCHRRWNEAATCDCQRHRQTSPLLTSASAAYRESSECYSWTDSLHIYLYQDYHYSTTYHTEYTPQKPHHWYKFCHYRRDGYYYYTCLMASFPWQPG